MTIKSIAELLAEHPFFAQLPNEYRTLVSECGTNQVIAAGKLILEEGKSADHFYLLRGGKVSIEIHAPGRGNVQLQTLASGDILGWSWLFPPYRWAVDAVALETVHAVALDATCLRAKCESDTRLGYLLMKKFSEIMSTRLQATLLQLVDVYANPLKTRGAG